jgi:hypothetical protein
MGPARDIIAHWRGVAVLSVSLPIPLVLRPATPAEKRGFSTWKGKYSERPDCLLEGTGFEPSVPRCACTADSAGGGVTPPDPGGEWRLLGPPLDRSIDAPRPATARMTGASVDRPQLRRAYKTVAYLPRN